MSSLIFSHARRIRKLALEAKKNVESNEFCNQALADKTYEMKIQHERTEFIEVLKIAKLLHDDYVEVIKGVTSQWYFITIRPDCSKITFELFYNKIAKLMDRKCFKTFTLSFEQKGTNQETLGQGFHCHIVTETTHRSKGELLRDLTSTFNKWINLQYITENNIDVKPSKTPEQLIQNYLIEYNSEDGHKEPTKQWDTLWREYNKIQPIYKDHVPSSSINHCNKPSTVIDCSKGLVVFE